MNDITTQLPLPTIGTPMEGGFFAGAINIDGQRFGLVRAPKALGQHDDTPWNDKWDRVAGAQSFCDGLANTEAMATAGSDIAKWARMQDIAGHNDWYIPAQDELEILYRNLKPTTDKNTLYGRSGVNTSALPPTYPYAEDAPAQTPLALFQEDGEEAFNPVWYWSSTQHAGDGGCAWCQGFAFGGQGGNHKGSQSRVVLVRRFPL